VGRLMRRVGLAALLLVASAGVGAQAPAVLAQRAREAYGAGRYEEASELYELMASSGADGAEVQYDLGNCLLKGGDVARAIVAYRRALEADPSLEPARRNLALARTLLPARAVAWQPPPWEVMLRSVGTGGWMVLTLALVVLGNACLWVALFLGPGLLRRSLVGALTALLVAAAVAGGLLYYQVHVVAQRQGAVVVAPARIFERPQRAGSLLATLPPGSEVVRVAAAGEWSLLLWGEGSGWADSSCVVVP